MKILVIGANGQLGSDALRVLQQASHDVVGANHSDVDISRIDMVRSCVSATRPTVIINTAAMHQIEKCEQDPLSSFAVNGVGARNVALAADEVNATLVHISTDYVFDGQKKDPYEEQDLPNPLNVYGNTKLAGETFVRTLTRRYFVCRVSALFGTAPCRAKGGLNFPQLMLHLAKTKNAVRVVDDEFISPTYTYDVASQLAQLIQTEAYGTYHCTSEGYCTWHGLAAKVFELTGTSVRLEAATPGEFPAKVPRPKYSVLENAGLKKLGINSMPHWSEGLARYLSLTQ